VETLSFKGNKNRQLLDFTIYKKYEVTYIREMKSEQGEVFVMIVEYFTIWTWGMYIKSFLVLSRYSVPDDRTEVEILHSWTPMNVFGMRMFRRTVAKDEKRFSDDLRQFVERPHADPRPMEPVRPRRIVLE